MFPSWCSRGVSEQEHDRNTPTKSHWDHLTHRSLQHYRHTPFSYSNTLAGTTYVSLFSLMLRMALTKWPPTTATLDQSDPHAWSGFPASVPVTLLVSVFVCMPLPYCLCFLVQEIPEDSVWWGAAQWDDHYHRWAQQQVGRFRSTHNLCNICSIFDKILQCVVFNRFKGIAQWRKSSAELFLIEVTSWSLMINLANCLLCCFPEVLDWLCDRFYMPRCCSLFLFSYYCFKLCSVVLSVCW